MRLTGSRSKTFGMVCDPIYHNVRAQVKQLAELDQSSSESPWTAARFKEELSKPHVACRGVYTPDGELIAYAIVRKIHLAVVILHMLVHRDHRGVGVGRMLIRCIDDHMLDAVRATAECVVSDRLTPFHHFLSHCGMTAVEVLPGVNDDKYVFRGKRGFSKSSS